MRSSRCAVLWLCCLPACLTQSYGEAPVDPAIPQKLVILHSTDTHSKYLPFWMEPNFFDRDMGLVSRFPACWDLDWTGGASFCEGAYDRDRDAYRVWTGGAYVYVNRNAINPDYPIEDLNHDGVCDVRDCQRCWDLDDDNRCDVQEDVDGVVGCSEGDCAAQPDIPRASRCWDLGSLDDPETPNGQCDAFEDKNRDRTCDFADCALVWDRDHDRACDNPFDLDQLTYVDDEGRPIVIDDYPDVVAYTVAYNAARQKSEDNNKDGICSYSDYRPGLLDTGGVARAATLQKRILAQHEGVAFLRLDSGDAFQGAPEYNLYRGEIEMLAMQKLDVDAMVLGNHEFDSGTKALVDAYRKSGGFQLLAANYIFDQEDDYGLSEIVSPYTIFYRGGLRIGVIGLGNDSSLTSLYNVSGSLGFNAMEPISIARRYVDYLRPQVDLVILLTHQGLDGDFALAQQVEGVDIILGGHHHVVLDPVKVLEGPDGRQVLVVHSGVNYKVLGELEVAVQNHRVVWHRYQLHPVTDAIPPDTHMLNVLEPYLQGLAYAQDLTTVVGNATSTIKRTDTNGGDSPLGNITTDAMMQHELARAQFAVTNSLGIRADIPTGEVTLEKLYEVFPFENTIVTMYLSGREIKDLFDFVARRSASRGCTTQVQVSGMRVVIDCSPPQEIIDRYGSYALTQFLQIGTTVVVDNYEAVQPHMVFKMATNDYMGKGGSGFDMLERNTTRLDTAVSLRDAVVEFFQEQGDIDPLRFTSGIGGEPRRIEMRN